VGTQLTLKTLDIGTHVFYVMGRTAGGSYNYQKVTFTVSCGPTSNVLTLTTAGTAIFEIAKNSDL